MDLKVLYEDNDVLVIDKPAGIVVFHEKDDGKRDPKTVIDYLIEEKPELKQVGQSPRYGVVHRLDKDTSGVLLIAKTDEALIFFQKQFKNREVEKKYIALATGPLREDSGVIETLIGRSPADPRKQKCYPMDEVGIGRRLAKSEYAVLQRFKQFTLIEMNMKTGRKHQLRAQLTYLHHPIAGDTLYEFKDSPKIEGLTRQFLHAAYIKIETPSHGAQEFHSPLPEDLQNILTTLT